ncbi:MAG TPA: DUF3579 domain-containing protein [Casimicrobiaceae bacterium]|nr:DUF3579 domain-containing protein [Casimicrobiaceae bacterium]
MRRIEDVPAEPESPAAAPRPDAVLWGITAAGRVFRPSDWAERLAGLTSAFGADQKLVYSPLVCPVDVRGVRALIVAHELADLEPRLYQFLMNFARDNELVLAFEAGAIDAPRRLVPPGMPAAGAEPREPV